MAFRAAAARAKKLTSTTRPTTRWVSSRSGIAWVVIDQALPLGISPNVSTREGEQ